MSREIWESRYAGAGDVEFAPKALAKPRRLAHHGMSALIDRVARKPR